MKGKIIQIIGPVVDIDFGENVPNIYDALLIKNEEKEITLETNII